MAEAEARVIDRQAGVATLASLSFPCCGDEEGDLGCDHSWAYGGRGLYRVHAVAPEGLRLRPGERVVVSLPPKRFLCASIAFYLTPLIGLFAAGGLVAALASSTALPDSEGWQFAGALAGGALTGLWQRRFDRGLRSDSSFQLRIARRLAPCSWPSSEDGFPSRG